MAKKRAEKRVKKAASVVSSDEPLLTVRASCIIEGDRVFIPKNLGTLKELLDRDEAIQMSVDTLADGTEGCAIAFLPYGSQDVAYDELQNGSAFGFVVDLPTLKAIRKLIDVAIDHFD